MFIMLVDIDSSLVDSSTTYEIPAVIIFGFDSTFAQKNLCITQETEPDYFNLDFSDALFKMPCLDINLGRAQPFMLFCQGQTTRFSNIFLNNHMLNDRLFNGFNLDRLSVQFAEKIILTSDQMHRRGLNIVSKVNHYDRPFSFVQYTTGSFGTNLYTADLSRPITNDLGFYLSGLHWTAAGHRLNNDHEISSFYTNFYLQKIIPSRFDIIYCSGTTGFPGTDQDTLNGTVIKDFIDVSLCTGNENHKMTAYYNMNTEEYTNLTAISPFKNTVKNLGIDLANYQKLKGFELDYRLAGALNMIDSDVYGSYDHNSLSLWARLARNINKFILAGSGLFEVENTEDFFSMPKFTIGVDVFDSTFVIGSLSKHYRHPSIAETSIPESIYTQYFTVVGNDLLRPESYWSQELSIKRKNANITLYKHDYDDRIILSIDSNGLYHAENLESWRIIGLESALATTIHLTQNLEKGTTTELSVGYYGNYIFQGDTLPLLPKSNSSVSITFKKQTQKFTIGATLQEQFVNKRQDFSGNEIAGFRTFSGLAFLRIFDLHISFGYNNIFDEEYFFIPNYTMPARNYSLAIKWDFWN